MGVFENSQMRGHEQVLFASDAATGLKAIIAIHCTVPGFAGGGVRFFPYGDSEAALTDALRLSRAMTYKMALAELPFGGGKSVIIGDPGTDKTEALLEAFGRAVDSLGGRYVCGEDVIYLRSMQDWCWTCAWTVIRVSPSFKEECKAPWDVKIKEDRAETHSL